MNVTVKTILLALALFLPHLQDDRNIFYVESWKRGTRHIQQQKITISLNKASPEYETLIKDSFGKPQYKLMVWPGRANGNGSGIIEWMVELIDLTQESGTNLLRPSNAAQQDYFSAKDRIGWLYPLKNPKAIGAESDVIPIFAKRVVKIEGFYLLIEVTDLQFGPRKGELNSITVTAEFTNSFQKT